MKKLVIALMSILVVSSLFAAGDNTPDASKWYVTPSLAYINSDQNRLTEDSGYGANFYLGKEVSDNLNLEFGFGVNRFDRQNISDLEQVGIELDALYFFNREATFAPYFVTGLGMFSTNETDDTNPNWSAGLGLLSDLSFMKSAKLKTEVRFQQEIDTSENKHDDIQLRVGFQIPFGEKPAPVKIPVKVDTDGDNDGVLDQYDNCPNTPAGVKVDANGCKIPAPKDSDFDGVNDANDQCPNTVRGAKVDSRGCELDSDNDGVVNSQDDCPNTTSGVRVDVNGCEIKNNKIQLPGVQFELNSSVLKAESFDVLNDAAKTLEVHSDLMVEVAGHTDSTGADAYNQTLSQARAKSVAKYLTAKGVAASRLQVKGYGETQPIAANSSKAGRALNRRVVLRILNQ